jgi:hemin uptake protein HemP
MSREPARREPGDRPLDEIKPAAAVRRLAREQRRPLGGATEVVIEHAHHRYRLKMTSRGGLILSK